MTEQWYKVKVYRAHIGSGRRDTTTAYIFADNILKVLDRYRTMPGVKRSLAKNKSLFPDIIQLSENDSRELERRIIEEGRIKLGTAKRTWYYDQLI